jgi:arsenate reductase
MRRERVLFLCTHNSARSQMAEGWLRALAGDRFEIASAGTEATRVHPLAVAAAERMHWSFDDPSQVQGKHEERLATFRRVRDEIAARLRVWLAAYPVR